MRQGAAARRRRARTYVQVVAAAAQRDDSWDSWEHDLRTLRAIAADDAVRAFLESPATPLAERLDLVDRVAGPSVSVNGLGLLHVLVTSRDVDVLPEIERGFMRIADRERRLDRVHVTTAAPLHDAETEELRQRLAEPGRRLQLTTTTDPALLGGFVVRRGDNVLDLSVRARLQSLGRALR